MSGDGYEKSNSISGDGASNNHACSSSASIDSQLSDITQIAASPHQSLPTKQLPTKRVVLQRYRYLRMNAITMKKSTILNQC